MDKDKKDKVIEFNKNAKKSRTNAKIIDKNTQKGNHAKKGNIVNTEKKENEKNNVGINNTKGKMSKRNKKILIISSISIIALVMVTLIVVYLANENAREFMDKYLFGKNISEENAEIIEIENENNTSIIGNSKNIGILTNNTLKQYNVNAKEESEINIEINNPIYDYADRYLVIGQKNDSKAYLIKDSKIVWEKELEGKISKISVNKNGYTSIVLTGTAYKTVIELYDTEGNRLTKIYLSKTIAVDTSISNDNKYLAFAEISTSSTNTKTNVKILSIDKAKEENLDAIVYTYEVPDSALATNVNYIDNGKLVCMFDNSIQVIENNTPSTIINLKDDKNISFAGIDLSDSAFKATEESSGLFSANTKVEITNVNNQKKNVYTVKGVAKSVKTYGNVIALNLGTEIEFIDTNGWLIKRYNSSSEVKDIILGDGIAGIIYKDKVELISL